MAGGTNDNKHLPIVSAKTIGSTTIGTASSLFTSTHSSPRVDSGTCILIYTNNCWHWSTLDETISIQPSFS